MAIKKINTRSDFFTYAALLNQREAFQAGANVYGAPKLASNERYGQLPALFWASFTNSDYAVWSYNTPIAWYSHLAESWIIPNVKYSNTTSAHQNKIRVALDHLGVPVHYPTYS